MINVNVELLALSIYNHDAFSPTIVERAHHKITVVVLLLNRLNYPDAVLDEWTVRMSTAHAKSYETYDKKSFHAG
ncbi:MAG: hypothetical protein JWO95_2856 [Verrucomicrobiales bacterium]|nr:hypothetical protein [Verrucomicrobiales bacterium]